jgi:hypothetical protein
MSATALSGRAVTSKDPQFLGYVLFDPDGGGEVHIDFLAFPTGLTAAAVAALAVEADVRWTASKRESCTRSTA